MINWISVKDKTPDNNDDVWVSDGERCSVGWYYHGYDADQFRPSKVDADEWGVEFDFTVKYWAEIKMPERQSK